jgi:hypothetical protein
MAIIEAKRIHNALIGAFFRAEFNGYPPFLIHKVKLPGYEIEVSEFGGGGQTLPIYQAGKGKVTDFTMDVIFPAKGPERRYMIDWVTLVLTRDTALYYRDGTVTLLGPKDEPNMIWDIEDAWPTNVDPEELDAMDGKKLFQKKIKFRCNDFKLRLR